MARRVLDSDEEFRARVVDTVTEGDVGRSGWLYLSRPEGWEKELAELVGEAADAVEREADRRAEGDARKRLTGAETARRRAEEAAIAAESVAGGRRWPWPTSVTPAGRPSSRRPSSRPGWPR